MSDRLAKWVNRLYGTADRFGAGDAVGSVAEADIRMAMGGALTQAMQESSNGQRLGAGKWAKAVLCGRRPSDGSVFASMVNVYTPGDINRVQIVAFGGYRFREAIDEVAGKNLEVLEAGDPDELRACLARPRRDEDYSAPRAVVSVEAVTPSSLKGGRCRAITTCCEAHSLLMGKPVALLYSQGDMTGDVIEMAGHANLEHRAIDCGGGLTASIVSPRPTE